MKFRVRGARKHHRVQSPVHEDQKDLFYRTADCQYGFYLLKDRLVCPSIPNGAIPRQTVLAPSAFRQRAALVSSMWVM